jgi:uncharacterized protein (DUF1501 family)
MPLSRRAFLMTAAASLPGLRSVALADPAKPDQGLAGQALIVVFLRGGCDGLSFLAPSNDPDYIADRAPELRVRDDGAKPGRSLRQTCDPAIDFRLHPEAAMLGDLYDGRHLALIHAAGLTDGTRSHFVAQDLMDRGLADSSGFRPQQDGWLTRVLKAHPSSAPAIATTPALPGSLAFHGASLAIPDLRGGLGLPGGPAIASALSALYAGASDPFGRSAAETLRQMDLVDRRLARQADGRIIPYSPEAGVAYEETESGRALRTVAQLLKMEIGLSVAAVDIGGWDHHDNLGGRFSSLVGQFARALTAFWTDVGRYHDRVTLVAMSEFGRRLRTNKSNGADHGHGGLMLVLGGRVNGGTLYGRWPGLASAHLDNGVDLAVTTDYRAVLAEILAVRLRLGPAATADIFPGFTLGRPLGIVAA